MPGAAARQADTVMPHDLELAAALAALRPEGRRLISRMNAAVVVACIEELAQERRKRIAARKAAADREPQSSGPHDPLASLSSDGDDAGHGAHL